MLFRSFFRGLLRGLLGSLLAPSAPGLRHFLCIRTQRDVETAALGFRHVCRNAILELNADLGTCRVVDDVERRDAFVFTHELGSRL